jgi:membrane-associated phospholipid phosphatase
LYDREFAAIDGALGFNWLNAVLLIDNHPLIHDFLLFCYGTMPEQIILPVVILSIREKVVDIRNYLAAFAMALAIVIGIAALAPAAGPLALVSQTGFHVLRFTGATPLDQFALLRQAGPVIIRSNSLGGIIDFPSFHAAVAVLTMIALRSRDASRTYAYCYQVLLIIEVGLLCGSISEGGHYLIDLISGGAAGITAYFLAPFLTSARKAPRVCRRLQIASRMEP